VSELFFILSFLSLPKFADDTFNNVASLLDQHDTSFLLNGLKNNRFTDVFPVSMKRRTFRRSKKNPRFNTRFRAIFCREMLSPPMSPLACIFPQRCCLLYHNHNHNHNHNHFAINKTTSSLCINTSILYNYHDTSIKDNQQ
jgi:hypothetical protein